MTSVRTVGETEPVSDPVVRINPGLLRNLLSTFAHTLMNAEVDARCGASGGQRAQRVNRRRGSRRRDLRTAVGRVELSIPRLRSGVYRPDWLVGRPEQAERALTDAIVFGYRHGFSTGQLRQLMDALGMSGIPGARVPDLAEVLEARLAAVRTGPAQPIPAQHTAPGAAELTEEPAHLATAGFLGIPGPPEQDSAPGPRTSTGPEAAGSGAGPDGDAAQRADSAASSPTPVAARRLLAGTAALILTVVSGVALCSLSAPQRAGDSSELQAMMPALVSVIEMPIHVTRADLLAATCGRLHDDFDRRSDAEIMGLVERMDRDFGPRTIDHVERLRGGARHTAHVLVTGTAERNVVRRHPAKPVDVEFDTSTTPWRICAVRPAAGH
jgi:hypothetical protein